MKNWKLLMSFLLASTFVATNADEMITRCKLCNVETNDEDCHKTKHLFSFCGSEVWRLTDGTIRCKLYDKRLLNCPYPKVSYEVKTSYAPAFTFCNQTGCTPPPGGE